MFASYVSRGQSKPRLIFSRINGPNVDVARISGAALHQLRKGREKVLFGRKGARKLSESTKENYAKEMKLMTEMVC